jgi:hypothetical protein
MWSFDGFRTLALKQCLPDAWANPFDALTKTWDLIQVRRGIVRKIYQSDVGYYEEWRPVLALCLGFAK